MIRFVRVCTDYSYVSSLSFVPLFKESDGNVCCWFRMWGCTYVWFIFKLCVRSLVVSITINLSERSDIKCTYKDGIKYNQQMRHAECRSRQHLELFVNTFPVKCVYLKNKRMGLPTMPCDFLARWGVFALLYFPVQVLHRSGDSSVGTATRDDSGSVAD
jgi:hypothetical protein